VPTDADARGNKLIELAKERGYVPPQPKYPAEHDYRGRDESSAIDYYQLLLDPQRTALLVIDMQNIFVREGAPISAAGAAEIVPPINRVVSTFRDLDLPIIWTAWCQRPDGSNMGRNTAFWRGIAPLAPDSDLAQIHPSLDFRDGDILIEKPKYNSFWGTDLQPILNTYGIESLVLAGIATDVCVGQTLVEAFHRDYNCAVVADGTATTTPFQQETLWVHENYWGRVLTAEEVEAELLTLAGRRHEASHPLTGNTSIKGVS
jgi:ureidoacrylate peracid hydrolase